MVVDRETGKGIADAEISPEAYDPRDSISVAKGPDINGMAEFEYAIVSGCRAGIGLKLFKISAQSGGKSGEVYISLGEAQGSSPIRKTIRLSK